MGAIKKGRASPFPAFKTGRKCHNLHRICGEAREKNTFVGGMLLPRTRQRSRRNWREKKRSDIKLHFFSQLKLFFAKRRGGESVGS